MNFNITKSEMAGDAVKENKKHKKTLFIGTMQDCNNEKISPTPPAHTHPVIFVGVQSGENSLIGHQLTNKTQFVFNALS